MPSLTFLDSVGSTNDELARRTDSHELSDFSCLATFNQTAGRGRLGRSWSAPAGSSLAVSVLVRRRALAVPDFGWLPLAAGLAMAEAVAEVVPPERLVGVKWPNDVMIDGLKVCGILAEVLVSGEGVVVGSGVNISATRQQLPVPTATSIVLAGGRADAVDELLAAYLRRYRRLVDAYIDAGADAGRSGIRQAVSERCVTLGREVRVELPGAEDLTGTAIELDDAGRLVVRTAGNRVVSVAAGDVTHVR